MTHIHGTTSNQPVSSRDGNAFSLQDGKVLNIRVHKLIGESIAEVSANGQRFIAKLDAPLEEGERYWVEVKQSETGVSLRLIRAQPGEIDEKSIALDLLRHLSFTGKEKEMTSLVMELVKNKIPVNKEMLLFAHKHIFGKGASENVKVLLEMAKRDLPFTERIFSSMKAGEANSGFISKLNILSSKLNETGRDASSLALLQKFQKPMRMVLVERLVIKALSGLINPSQSFSNRLGHFDLLKSLGFFQEEVAMNQWKEGLTATIQEGISSNEPLERKLEFLKGTVEGNPVGEKLRNEVTKLQETMVNNKSDIPKAVRSFVDKWINAMKDSEGFMNDHTDKPTLNMAKLLMGLVGEEKRQLMEVNYTKLENTWSNGVPASNQERIFQKLYHQLEQDITHQIQGDELAKVLKRVIGAFGVNYEAQLQNNGYDIQNLTLKEHLVGLSGNHPLQEIRQLADDIVLKMNHQVLQSQENAPFLTIVQQFPLFLFGRDTDITLQWTGKEKEKGVIDEDYCRVLFYLELDSLNETLVDMQVQNRVITLTVWNEHPDVERVSRFLLPDLKEGLEGLDYRLSTVKVKIPDKHIGLSETSIEEHASRTFSGVDIKI
ncbi:hypothetical protein FGG79_06740 [Bacillus sp. BHET2]|uniref:hypothetical protein n=1 Tax=Bacillus sp. BHET2 TaxID=2583818 RepID=UPI00110F4AC6|nr:hypothetical protein [Bacillus sp. BHET2]TMU87804.1 hypothetical protein FGG79_06740 [Bacillus sp. BHET2]